MGFLIVEIDLNAFPGEVHEEDIKEVLDQVYPGVKMTGHVTLVTTQQKGKEVGFSYFNHLSVRRELEQARKLIEAAAFASDVCAELYAKYQTRIGPFASQAQLANVRLRKAIADVRKGAPA